MTTLDTWLHALDSAKYARSVLVDCRAKLEASGARSSDLAQNAKLIAEADASIAVAEALIARLMLPPQALALCESNRPQPTPLAATLPCQPVLAACLPRAPEPCTHGPDTPALS